MIKTPRVYIKILIIRLTFDKQSAGWFIY